VANETFNRELLTWLATVTLHLRRDFPMVQRVASAVCTLALSVAAVVSGHPAFAATSQAALWHLDETGGGSALDSSGRNDGTPYSVVTGVPGAANTAYRFDGTSSRVVVPSSVSLNPGLADFSFGAVARLTVKPASSGDTYDVLRKGLSFTAGGEYKLEVVNVNGVARARCIAKDSAGRVARLTHSKSLADGAWHQLACARTGSVWAVTVDGATTSKTLPLGSVGNSSALSIGAKLGGKTGGDWFRGDLDEAHLEID